MKLFKISLKELIILIVLSAPIGAFLFLHNYNKINYEIQARRGFAVTENFCESFDYKKLYLQGDADIGVLTKIYRSNQKNSSLRDSSQIKLLTRNEVEILSINIRGVVGNEAAMAEAGHKLLEAISEQEIARFNSLYQTVKLHCKVGVVTIFKMVPLEKINNRYPITRSYKNSYLGALLIIPLIIIYLLFIAFKYVNKISIINKN
jgi:hypothetical protein